MAFVPETDKVTIVADESATDQYRTFYEGPAEVHQVRTDLLPQKDAIGSRALPFARIIQITDFQLADLCSPSRLDYLQRYFDNPNVHGLIPAYRPQEFLLPFAIESTIETINAVAHDRKVDLVLFTGDQVDTAQFNELKHFFTLADGGTYDPTVDNAELANSPTALGDPAYWDPDPDAIDSWKSNLGFPGFSGLLARAAQKFTANGLQTPWLACLGNHDLLLQGRVPTPKGYEAFLTGNKKPVELAENKLGATHWYEKYVDDPMWAADGAAIGITATDSRATFQKKDIIQSHLNSPSEPKGHGFTEKNISDNTGYYSYDLPSEAGRIRYLVLDTNNSAGHYDGCLDREQFTWLEEQLIACHSSYLSASGDPHHTTNQDQLIVIASHHGLSTLTNARGDNTWGGKLALANEVEALLHRFPNVALWLSGHVHVNRVTPRTGASGGFYEVSTSAIAEWPVQLRQIEFVLENPECLRIRLTMLNTSSPLEAGRYAQLKTEAESADGHELAAIHREIAANDPGSVGGKFAEGTLADRNVDLLVPISKSLGNTLMFSS